MPRDAHCCTSRLTSDSRAGQFTQMDPIGLNGGYNQYSFASGDPIGNSDPFGLRVCFDGASPADSRALQQGYERAAGTTVTKKDSEGCAVDANRTAGTTVSQEISDAFIGLTRSSTTYRTQFGRRPSAGAGDAGSGGDPGPKGYTFYIDQSDVGRGYGAFPDIMAPGTCQWTQGANFTLPQIIVHEMGHMYDFESPNSSHQHYWAVRLERLQVMANNNQPFRGHACHAR